MRNLRLEKVVASKPLRLAVETEEERARLAKEMERKERLENMVATAQVMLALVKGVADVGMVLSLNPFDAVDALKRSEDRTRYSNF